MRIGLRTVKTALSAMLAYIVADLLHLLYPTAAGIIAVLSVTNTKRSSWITGFSRLASLALATAVSLVVFNLLGYTPLAFGLYLLLFIPLAVRLGLSEGIVVSSVLATHYLVEQRMDLAIILNEFLLMGLGVGFALLMNLYMPDVEKRLKENQQVIESEFRTILRGLSVCLTSEEPVDLTENCDQLLLYIDESQNWAVQHAENRLFSSGSYYLEYLQMRRLQMHTLRDMVEVVQFISAAARRDQLQVSQIENLQQLLLFTAENLAEENDSQEFKAMIQETLADYRQQPLPTTREEFEIRASLFQLLQLFQNFIEIKVSFVQTTVKK